jgi:hypothetical protein
VPVPAYVEEWEANSPSNLPSKVTPLARRSPAPAEASAEFFAGMAPLTMKLAPKWSAAELSRRLAVSLRTIRRAELTEGHSSMTKANDLAIRHALEAAGVEFIDENGGGRVSDCTNVFTPNQPAVGLGRSRTDKRTTICTH